MKKLQGNKVKKSGHYPSKPFCDCSLRQCNCKNCQDITDILRTPVNEVVNLVPKKSRTNTIRLKKKKVSSSKNSLHERRPSLLDILKDNQDCNCEVMARAVRSNIHKNLGLSERHAEHSKRL